jgi:hypothetical protein
MNIKIKISKDQISADFLVLNGSLLKNEPGIAATVTYLSMQTMHNSIPPLCRLKN